MESVVANVAKEMDSVSIYDFRNQFSISQSHSRRAGEWGFTGI
jgi:hypothetical protein